MSTDRLRADFRRIVHAARSEADVATGCAKIINAIAWKIADEARRGIGSDNATQLMRDLASELSASAQALGAALAEKPKAKPSLVGRAHAVPDLEHAETTTISASHTAGREHQKRDDR